MFDADARIISVSVLPSFGDYMYTREVKRLAYDVAVNEDSDKILPGCVAMGQVEVAIYATFPDTIAGETLDISITAKNMATGYTETAFLGRFTVAECRTIDGSGLSVLTAYDAIAAFETDYVSELTYPAKIADMLTEIGQQAGVTVYTGSEPSDIEHIAVPNIKIAECPVGYTCREMLGHIAGMCGGFAVDAMAQAPANIHYNGVVIKRYTAADVAVGQWAIPVDGLRFSTDAAVTETTSVCVESSVYEIESSDAGTGVSDPESIGSMQSPDDLAGLESLVSEQNFLSFKNFYSPYWIMFKRHDYGLNDAGIPAYFVYFFADATAFEITQTTNSLFGYVTETFKSVSKYAGVAYNFFISDHSVRKLEWIHFDSGTIKMSLSWYPSSDETCWYEIVAASYDILDTDGNLIFAANGSEVGAGGSGGSGSTTEICIEYGHGDYTNPFIDANNLLAVAQQQKARTWRPGTLRFRGNPFLRAGMGFYVEAADGTMNYMLASSVSIVCDGGMSMTVESHGSENSFSRLSGVDSELKRVRAMRTLWNYKNME